MTNKEVIMSHLLLVEDDIGIIRNLTYLLDNEGYKVTTKMNKKQAVEIIEKELFDLVLLDVTLPDGNGFEICQLIKKKSQTPVIFLTASDDEISVVKGLEIGAEDYITKPFRPMELIARVRKALRKHGKIPSIYEINDLKLDSLRAMVWKSDKEVFLSALEYKIMLVFLNNRGIVLSRSRLLDEIWDMAGEFVNDNTLTVYIKRIREKIEDDPQNPKIIKTVRGIGYKVGD